MIGVEFKEGVKVHPDSWGMPEVCRIVVQAQALAPPGYGITITSGCDGAGKHKPGSKHFTGKALDFRTKDLPQNASPWVWEERLQKRLGDEYFVEYEPKKVHLHAQWNG